MEGKVGAIPLVAIYLVLSIVAPILFVFSLFQYFDFQAINTLAGNQIILNDKIQKLLPTPTAPVASVSAEPTVVIVPTVAVNTFKPVVRPSLGR